MTFLVIAWEDVEFIAGAISLVFIKILSDLSTWICTILIRKYEFAITFLQVKAIFTFVVRWLAVIFGKLTRINVGMIKVMNSVFCIM